MNASYYKKTNNYVVRPTEYGYIQIPTYVQYIVGTT